jgi:biopolymer transport protein ExbD
MGIVASGSAVGSKPEINVVPLIDILLVLIIIFMVIAPLAPKGLEAVLPEERSEPNPGPPQRIIVVEVDAGKAVRINSEPVMWEKMQARLSFIFRDRAEKAAFVRAEDPVEFQDVARAIAIMRDAGIEQIGLLTPRAVRGL